MMALPRARSKRILSSRTLAVHVSLAFVLLVVPAWPGVSDAADRPASPGELQGLRDQIAGLQAQQQGRWADLNQANQDIVDIQSKIAAIDAIDGLWGPAKDAAIAAYMRAQGLDPSNAPIAWAYMKIAEKTNLENRLKGAIARRDTITNQIADLDSRIAQAQANVTYWQNPVGTDIKNEREHLGNIENQPPPKDDFDRRQRQQDIDSSRQRIKELEDLERQFQQSQPGSQTTTSGQSVQPQSSAYTAPSSGFGPSGSTQPAGQQGQQLGHGQGADTGSFEPPKYEKIQEKIQGSIGEKPGMSKPGGG